MESYPCYQDEETKIAFADYTVTYGDQPPNSWFIVFRLVYSIMYWQVMSPLNGMQYSYVQTFLYDSSKSMNF